MEEYIPYVCDIQAAFLLGHVADSLLSADVGGLDFLNMGEKE